MSRSTYLAAAALFLIGLLSGLGVWGGYETATALVTGNAFCTNACHEMQTVADEYRQSIHFTNPAGVRAQCADCHVPKPFVARIVHMIGASRDIVGHVTGVIDTPAKFEAHRLDMAKRVWAEMTANGSLGCRSCHTFEAMDFAKQRPKAAEAMHAPMQPGTSCINCHKGIAHRLAVVAPKPPIAAAKPPPAPAPTLPATPPAAAGTPATPSATRFVGEATAPLAAAPGGTAFATLYVSTPIAVIGSESGSDHVTATLWMKEAAASGPLYASPNGIEVGRLDAAPAANAKAGAPVEGWTPVEIDGYLAADAVVETLEPIWQAAESTYEFTCGGCHALHAAEAYTPAQWSTEMTTMAKSANLRPEDAMFVLKWLQTTSLASHAGK